MSDTPHESTHPSAEDTDVHAGWTMTPQDEYELGVSGGWGTPGDHLTGPIPTLRPAGPSATTAEDPTGDAIGDAIDDIVPPDPVIQFDTGSSGGPASASPRPTLDDTAADG